MKMLGSVLPHEHERMIPHERCWMTQVCLVIEQPRALTTTHATVTSQHSPNCRDLSFELPSRRFHLGQCRELISGMTQQQARSPHSAMQDAAGYTSLGYMQETRRVLGRGAVPMQPPSHREARSEANFERSGWRPKPKKCRVS